ncbi:cation:proton antiporter [bacterium]|nr:cation:proton antiporter [bacterium]|tara:strand:- start:98 stop:340 length:243 start_codon:yes stop_codon:yes gene_type:complete
MIFELNVFLYLVLFALAIVALKNKDLVVSAISLGGFSFCMAILYSSLGAVDVGLTEAVIGAGVNSVIVVAAIWHLRTSKQ